MLASSGCENSDSAVSCMSHSVHAVEADGLSREAVRQSENTQHMACVGSVSNYFRCLLYSGNTQQLK